MKTPTISVIVSTYNQPEWLHKTLLGYQCQVFNSFEIIIADDGSDDRTKAVIDRFQANSTLQIIHVWHKDSGFRKTTILNKAILASNSMYLIFTDGDCIPRADFVAAHYQKRTPNMFLSGGCFRLPKTISDFIRDQDIKSQNCFDPKWLLNLGLKNNFKIHKLCSKGVKEKLLNKFTTTKATWNGMNSSAWKKDIIAVNGFDTRMHYGGEDREFGERLINNKIKGFQIRYSAICLHLFHLRDYKNEETLISDKIIRVKAKKEKIIKTPYGIELL
jgi:glycosyltransferase involved in cell wall biosynthesis